MIAPWALMPMAVSAGILAWGAWLLPDGWPRTAGWSVLIAVMLFEVWFFRSPRRTPPPGERNLVAPADGTVWDVSELDEPEFLKCRAVRIGIFLSVFDVHVNRSPCAGSVVYGRHRPGRFLDVRSPDCPDANEAFTLGIQADPVVAPGLRLTVRQLAGLIARRIICAASDGDPLRRGELYGMIRFGSRTELWIPADQAHRVLVKVGDKVRGGETILAEILPTLAAQP